MQSVHKKLIHCVGEKNRDRVYALYNIAKAGKGAHARGKQALPARGGKRLFMVPGGHLMAENDSSWLQEDTSWRRQTSHGAK